MTIVALLIGLVAGLALGVTGALFALRERLQSATQALGRANELEVEARGYERRAIEAEAQLAAERGSLDERVAGAVRAASTAAMKESSGAFLDLAQTKLDAYVAPLRESLGKVETQVTALESARKEAYGSLTEAVRSLREDQLRLRSETSNLVTALRAPHVRGRWGEIQLRRVVELAGMVQHCDFVEQPTTEDGDGRVLRPDVLVRLPGGKCIVVDSKAPLAAYLDAFAAEVTDDARQIALRDHARQVRDHIGKLAAKRYWQQFEPAPEFVIMFLPDETFFRVACEADASLLELGPESGVLASSPTSLIGLLKVFAYAWQQETIAQDARDIAALGRELYERLGVFASHFAKVGRALGTAVGAYNDATGSLERRLLVTARKFEDHGAASGELGEVEPLEKTPLPLTATELTRAELTPPAAADAA